MGFWSPFMKKTRAYFREMTSNIVIPDVNMFGTSLGDRVGCDEDGTLVVSADWDRSEERRVGKECPTMCRSRWSPYH